VIADLVLFALAVGVVVLTVRFFAEQRRKRALQAADVPAS
jgi:hypothetical protein